MELSFYGPRLRLILVAVVIITLSLVTYVMWPRQDVVAGYAYPVPPQQADNAIEVLNGTTRRGLARNGTRALRAAGFDVLYFGNADTTVDSTVILIRRDSEAIGVRLKRVLGPSVVLFEPDSFRRVDATVILGPDYDPPPAWER